MNAPTTAQLIPFVYKVEATLAAAVGATSTQNLVFQADSSFELYAILATGGVDATTENLLVNPNSFKVAIKDNTTGRDFTSGPIPQRVICGNAFNQILQARPTVFPPQANLQFTFENLTAAANSITLTLVGYKRILS